MKVTKYAIKRTDVRNTTKTTAAANDNFRNRCRSHVAANDNLPIALRLPFADGQFSVVYMDPPFSYNDKGFGKRPGGSLKGSFAPEAGRYPTMSLHDLDLLATEVDRVTAKDAAILSWVPPAHLEYGIRHVRSCGFRYVTVAFVWSKITVNGVEVANFGHYTLGNVELCLLGVKGSIKRESRKVRQLVTAERTIHSMKPPEVRSRIEELFGDVGRLELFARQTAPGWVSWGNEV
jgi:N6-adenosine-specific RNA methylase IME4